ncbi:MAG: nucleotidyltransferase domain-containing protein [Planctomycetes bacterium]|nr:nucleotidyltransferase domain-containing protein [Planctomycetota bacterium]
MAKTALELTPEQWKQYEPWRNFKPAVERWERAWKVAREAARILRNEFGATRVVVFGSLRSKNLYTQWSDVDLAVSGIPRSRYLEAMGRLLDLSPEFKIDLIDLDSCDERFLECIESQGIEV